LKDVSGSEAVQAVLKRTATEIQELDVISKQVRSELHHWVAAQFHKLSFTDVAEATFARYKAALHRVLIEVAPDVAEKVPSVYDRLRAAPGDREAVSQAMNTCRRMIHALADALYPPSPAVVTDGEGIEHKLTEDKPKNRLIEYIAPRCSASRRDRLRKILDIVYGKVSGGLKAEGFAIEEAEPLFLQTYLVLGEIASLPDRAPT
jgi:hypothetical protein